MNGHASDAQIVQRYVQEAHNRGGGTYMALLMLAQDLLRAVDGRPVTLLAENGRDRKDDDPA